MKILKRMRVTLALVLTLTFIALVPFSTVGAAENNGKYVSEVYIAYGKDEEAAEKVLTDKGFTPIKKRYDNQVNNINTKGETAAVLGYKTTNDIRDSITDLAVMNMRGDYSVEDYKTLLKSQKTEIAEFLGEFMAVIKEYRANLKVGKQKVIYVHDLLNNYTDADGGSYALNYKAVECNREKYFGTDYKKQKGNCADLLADEGKQWLVLYASKNSKAGKPIVPSLFVDEYSKPSNYSNSVHMIGEKGAVNVVSGSFKNYSTWSQTWQNITGDNENYIHFNVSDDVKTIDESEGNMKATAMSGGTIAIVGFGSLAVGIALGAVITVLVKKRKRRRHD